MASCEDFKRILEIYNQESKSSGVSIVSFCQKNGIVYSQFERWYKNRHNVKAHAVDIVDKNGAYKVQNTCTSPCVIDKKNTPEQIKKRRHRRHRRDVDRSISPMYSAD